jgi:hypothetical protein
MTCEVDGKTDGHVPNFVRIYFRLICRYFGKEPDDSLKSAAGDGIEVLPGAIQFSSM